MGELYPRHEKQTKNPAETTGNRYKIEILMSRTQKLKVLSAASLILKTLNDNPYINEVNTGLKQMHRSRVTEDMWTYLGWDEFRMKYPGLYCIFIDYVRNYR